MKLEQKKPNNNEKYSSMLDNRFFPPNTCHNCGSVQLNSTKYSKSIPEYMDDNDDKSTKWDNEQMSGLRATNHTDNEVHRIAD